MKELITFILLPLAILLAEPVYGQNDSLPELGVTELRSGDLVFAVNNVGNAITESTSNDKELPIDHVGIVAKDSGETFVVEATTGYGVRRVGLSQFMDDNPLCVVGRVAGLDAVTSIHKAMKYEGLPYDSLFEPDDSAMYCSELVQKSYVDSVGQTIFKTIPMSFHDSTGKILPYWTELYRRHGKNVPEGAPGTNPSQLSKDRRIKLVGWLYK